MDPLHQAIPGDVLTTDRLLLKALTPASVQQVFTTFNPAQIKMFMGYTDDNELIAEQEKYMAGLTMHNRTFLKFLLIDKESTKVIGKCGFHTWMPMHSRAEIGYAMCGAQYMGKGYMKEAFRPIINYGFEHMELNRIEAFIGTHNTASIKLVTGLGFVCEGILREHYCKNGIIEDSASYSLLRKEWQ